MTRLRRYTPGQLALAKCLVVVGLSVPGGIALADTPGERPVSIVVVLLMLGALLGTYELGSRGLARVFGRLRPPPQPAVPAPPETDGAAPLSRALRPWHLAALVGAFVGGQAAVWLVGAIIAAAKAGGGDEAAITAWLLRLSPVLLPAGTVAGGVALLLTLRAWRQRLGAPGFAEVLPTGWGTARQTSLAAIGGLGIGLAYLALGSLVPYEQDAPSLLVQAAITPGATRWAWALCGLLLAPPIEEAVFRGALFGGIASLWGVPAAAVGSALAFWAMHATEWAVYWPAAIGIGVLTILLTVVRLRTRSLAPCMAGHLGYNLVMAAVVFGAGTGHAT